MTVLVGALREAANRKVLPIGLVVSFGFVGLFWLGFATAFGRVTAETGDDFSQVAAATIMTVLGLYAVQFLAAFLAILLAAGSVAGELDSGRALAVLARPVARWSWLAQRGLAFGGLAVTYVSVMSVGVLVVAATVGGYGPLSATRAIALLALEMVVLVALGVALSTRLSTVASGVVVVALYGLAWLAGIMEFVGRAVDNPALERIGVVVSLVMPTDALWRGASFYLQPAAFLLAPDTGPGIPFAAVAPPSTALIIWAMGYVTVCAWVAAKSLGARDL